MPIRTEAIGAKSDPQEARWDYRDCIIYALGVGAGMTDPTGFELEFTTENSAGLPQRVLPTFAVAPILRLLGGGSAMAELGDTNPAMIVHGAQAFELHRPIPTEGHIRSQAEIVEIWDKGSGAAVVCEITSVDAATGEPVFTNRSTVFHRGAGGWGGERGPSNTVELPDRDPDHIATYTTRTDQALLYRMSGDPNPLHSDPEFAKKGGFDIPILHGLCTYGFAGRALLHSLCGSDPDRFTSMSGRFSKPVFPGDQLTVSIWDLGGGEAAFRTDNGQGETVLDGGRCTFTS